MSLMTGVGGSHISGTPVSDGIVVVPPLEITRTLGPGDLLDHLGAWELKSKKT